MGKILTIGMATYQDPHGVYMTLTILQDWFDLSEVEILVIDNLLEGSKSTGARTHAAGGRYFHRPDLSGTSAPRDAIFRRARTPWTLVCDSHVPFKPGSVQAALEYCKANPESIDLIQGPLIGDSGNEVGTCLRPTHHPGLWGMWDVVWMTPEGQFFIPKPSEDEKTGFFGLVFQGYTIPPPYYGKTFPWGDHARELRAMGCIPAHEQDEPFEIPMQGLGLFMMRTAAWPGFNRRFREFGNEEGYIAEKVRMLGGRVLCLPKLRWGHHFRNDENKPTYSASTPTMVMNLLVGHRELGINANEEIKKAHGKDIRDEDFSKMIEVASNIQPEGELDTFPKPIKILGVWYTNNAAPAKVLEHSLLSIKKAQESSRHEVNVVLSAHEPFANSNFPVHVRKPEQKGHLAIIQQIRWAYEEGVRKYGKPDVICFLEHDVLYRPDYFDIAGEGFANNPEAEVVSNLDYIGLCAKGWQGVKERHEPMHQLSMRTDFALENLVRAENEMQDWGTLLEPQGDRSKWLRTSVLNRTPSVHINWQPESGKPGRFTSHGEVVFDPNQCVQYHPFWGQHKDYWPGKIEECGCTAGDLQAPPRKAPAMTLEQWYEAVLKSPVDPSGFRSHLPVIRELAAKCNHVTEVSTWIKPASVALAIGTGDKFAAYAPGPKPEWSDFAFLLKDKFQAKLVNLNEEFQIDETDLLFLDMGHNASELDRHLKRLSLRVRKYFVLHTTRLYGEGGDDGGAGLIVGVRRFLLANKGWTCIHNSEEDHGLMVFSKLDEDKKQPPGILTKMRNISIATGKAIAHVAAGGQATVPDSVYEERIGHCLTCPSLNFDDCTECGCKVAWKAMMASEECGYGKTDPSKRKWFALPIVTN